MFGPICDVNISNNSVFSVVKSDLNAIQYISNNFQRFAVVSCGNDIYIYMDKSSSVSS